MKFRLFGSSLLFLTVSLSGISGERDEDPTVATFSIVAVDGDTGEIGVAVQSKIVGVASVVSWARAGVGAVATQASANVRYGPVGLMMLEIGTTPEQAIELLTRNDPRRDFRQIGIISAEGEPATYTGEKCLDWAGSRTGEGYAVQGNILTGKEVIDAMAEAFEKAEGVLAERLLAALEAGQAAGGDKRGRQSAGLLVVREGWGYGGLNDRFRDLRVEEHETPIRELRRVYEKHREMFRRPDGKESPEKPKKAEPEKKTKNAEPEKAEPEKKAEKPNSN